MSDVQHAIPQADPAPSTFPSSGKGFVALLWAASLLAGFVLLLYTRLLLTNRVLADGDIFTYFYPYRAYAAAALRDGRIPLWNPYIFLGAPFLANPQAAVLYPLHWPLSWLPVTKQIYWSAALHTWLLGLGGYVLARQWHSGFWASMVTALVLAGSGFYGGLVGHINQMNGAAWLPWMVLVLEWGTPPKSSSGKLQAARKIDRALVIDLRAIAVLALLVAFSILAGHTQTAYINLFGAGVWAVWPLWGSAWRAVIRRLAVYGGGVLLGVLLSSAQILPTLELSALGLRSGGLSYAEASSFSLPLRKLPWTLLPTYGLVDLSVVFASDGYTEFVAYVGLLALALAGLGVWNRSSRLDKPARTFGLLFAFLGFFLAIGRWNPVYYLLYWAMPGFDLFRAPARWMMLYTLGLAMLAGQGWLWVVSLVGDLSSQKLQASGKILGRHVFSASGLWGALLCGLLVLELYLAAASLPHQQPTAPEAVYGMRTAPAHLLIDPVRTAISPSAMGRFLSLSTITFDPGDMQDFRRIFLESKPPQLDQRAFDQLVVALKAQEILAPNLALLWRVPGVDGFDGGVLPLQRYLEFLTILIDPADLVPDGRLREQLTQIPNSALLGLLNVQYVITDKVRDLWFEDVYYDRQIGARLPAAEATPVWIEAPVDFPATHIHLIGYVEGNADALARLATTIEEVAVIEVFAANASAADVFGSSELLERSSADNDTVLAARFSLGAGGASGADFADGALDSSMAASGGAVVALRDIEQGRQVYRAVRALPAPAYVSGIRLQAAAVDGNAAIDPAIDVVIQAVTLVDARTDTFVSLLPSDQGRFRRVHSGDVKIYENLDLVTRAYLVPQVEVVRDAALALETVGSAGFDPAAMAVIEDEGTGAPAIASQADGVSDSTVSGDALIVSHEPEEVIIRTQAQAPALLVLSDVFYPGWQATVDGVATPIYRANYLFRGVEVPAGEHTITFTYRPATWRRGLWLSGAGMLIWVGLMIGQITIRFRSPSGPGV